MEAYEEIITRLRRLGSELDNIADILPVQDLSESLSDSAGDIAEVADQLESRGEALCNDEE